MTELRRWLDSDDVDDDVRALLRSAPRPRAMTAGERARSAQSLGRIAALPVAAGLMFWVKNVALAGMLGAVGGVVVSGAVILATDREEPAQSKLAPAPKAIAVEQSKPAALAQPPIQASEPEQPRKKVLASSPALSASSAPSADTLALEARKLEQARRALAPDPASALALISEHAREFPKGKLGAERELLAIDALMRLGRTAEARGRAEAMLARSPGGLYEQRLRRMLSSMR